MTKRWTILSADGAEVKALQHSLGIGEVLCKILVQRGVKTYQTAKDFFRPERSMCHDPFLMKDMDKAVDNVVLALTDKEKILIYGDYDVDGTTAVATVFSFLREQCDPQLIDFYIPHRYREGYGISKAGIDFAFANGYTLIIALDCGIKSVDLVAYAAKMGIRFIICDHHLPGDSLPAAAAILNAKQTGCYYPYKDLCGCGVGFKLIEALCKQLNINPDAADQYLDLVATAIAADIVPMTGENRIFAYYGLLQINTSPLPGIAALIKLAACKLPLSITNVVFVIAPRINAAGRMDDAKKAVQLFIEKDETAAMEFAEMLHSDNTERKEADKSITEHALEILNADEHIANKKSTVVYNANWHKGVVGIVASRLIETFHRPTVVLTLSGNLATGSARSVAGFNLYEAIYACREYLTTYGGHFAAAGLSMLPENVELFRKQFEKFVSENIDEKLLIPEIVIDAEILFKDINQGMYNIICQMEPFGPENLRPVFISRSVKDTGYSKIVKEAHIRFVVQQNDSSITGIGFNMADKFDVLANRQPFDIVYTIDENVYNGSTSLQLKVIDIRPSP